MGRKSSRIWIFRNNVLSTIGDLAVDSFFERGINGMAVDPDYPTEPYLYIYRTLPSSINRLSKFYFDIDLNQLTTETVLFEIGGKSNMLPWT